MDDQAVVVASIIIACLMAVIAILWKTLFDPTVHQNSQARPTVRYESYDRSRFDRNSFRFSSFTTAVDPVPPPLRGTEQFKKIRVIDSINLSTERIIKELKSHCDEFPVLGFDCEWPNSKDGRELVALLQLQSYRGLCVLIRLNLLNAIPSGLKEIMENAKIIKVGVAPDTDAKYLNDDYDLKVSSTFDLRYMAVSAGCQPGTLAKMSEQYLGLHLRKGSDKALHLDWEKLYLSDKEKEYASMDVYAAIELFKVFAKTLKQAESLRSEQDRVNDVITNYCFKFLNKYYNGAQGIPSDAFM